MTALRARGRRVAVELDGAAWRTLPVDAVVEARLAVGAVMHRERVRALVLALRRDRARQMTVRSLARRDRSRAELDTTLERAGIRSADRYEALDSAARAGLVDDARLAVNRARALAERGAGDRLVLDDLRRRGIDAELAREALARIEPERARVERIVLARGRGQKTLRYLASRGFSEESLDDLIAELESRALP